MPECSEVMNTVDQNISIVSQYVTYRIQLKSVTRQLREKQTVKLVLTEHG